MKKSFFAKAFTVIALALIIALSAKQDAKAANFSLTLNDS